MGKSDGGRVVVAVAVALVVRSLRDTSVGFINPLKITEAGTATRDVGAAITATINCLTCTL